MRSTKQPLSQSSKRRKRQNPEDELLEKAINCMETASAEKPSTKLDEFDLFGKYIAAELRATDNAHARCWAKLQIQTILFDMQTGTMRSSSTMHSYPAMPHPISRVSTPTGSFTSYSEEPHFASPPSFGESDI